MRMLAKGFEAQEAGRGTEALLAYRHVQEAKPLASPMLRSLAGNAEGLLLLRAPGLIGDALETNAGDESFMPLESFTP